MKVISHKPHYWFLLEDGPALFLDVSCEHDAVGYSVLVQLDSEEERRYRAEGTRDVQSLADAISHSAPGVPDSDSPFRERNVSARYDSRVIAAIKSWRNEEQENN